MKRHFTFFTLLIILALFLAGCSPAAPADEVSPEVPDTVILEDPVEPEDPVEEPVVEDPVVETMATMDDLDAAFSRLYLGMERYNTIGIDALNEMLAEDADVFLLDVRKPAELEEHGWIEGAVNIPLHALPDHFDALPSFDTTIVSYCGSGWRCTIALTYLEALGWENVLGLKGGSFGGWVDAGMPIATGEIPPLEILNAVELDPALVASLSDVIYAIPDNFGVTTADTLLADLVEQPDMILIDVRRQEEVDEKGFIDAENVLFIPLEQFIAERASWPMDLDTPILIYCGSGHRSTIAMSMMWAYGYTDVGSLKGGFNGWAAASYPTVGGIPAFDLDVAFETFLLGMEGYNTVSLDTLNIMMASDTPPFILDVRQPEELIENGWIEGAVNIPIREVADHLDQLPGFDTTIVTYCGSGWRCTIVMPTLEALGWENVLSLKGGSFGGWVDAGYPIATGETVPEPVILDMADPNPDGVTIMQEMLHSVPDGYGVISADALFTELVENPDLIVIDVRRMEEVQEQGVIEAENWIHIPLESFVEMKDLWPQDLDAEIVIYCAGGHRSTVAMGMMWTYGYTNVRSLRGGFGGWVDAGYPVVEAALVPW